MQDSGLLTCCVCLCPLGSNGGAPATLPCGHNGCLQCFTDVQTRKPECPLCRTPFDPQLQLAPNHGLRDLMTFANSMFMDDKTREDGWEAFPTAKCMAEHYAQEVKQEPRDQAIRQLLQQRSEASAPPLHACSSSMSDSQDAAAAAAATAPAAASPPVLPSATQQQILEMDPPQWWPDSSASTCNACHLSFRPLFRLRHHCRLCGKIFCHACCHSSMLLPPRFNQREPQRVCGLCAAVLAPLQGYLVGTLSASSQHPVHDALDAVSLRSWFNSPWTSTLEADIYKSTNMVLGFTQAARLERERGLPSSVLSGAKGLAVLSVLRVGVGWSATMGTGLVIARQRDGTWSAPCAAACYGVGWGLQLGSELTDLLLVIRTEEALRAFCSRAHLGLGGSAGLAVGPVGRAADASVRVAPTVAAARGGPSVVGYSCSKGAYIGVSLEGSVTCVREGVNMRFYGYPTTASQLLMEGRVPQPPAASMLYEALDGLMAKFEAHPVPSAAAAAAAAGARGAAAVLAVASSSSSAACGAAAAAAAKSWGADSALSQHSGREDISSSEDDTEEVTADHVLGAVPASAPAAACPLTGRRARVSQPPAAADAPAATVVAATESESEEESDGYPQFELTW